MMYVKALRFCSKICSSLYIGWNKIYFFLNNIKYGKNFRVFNHLYLKIHVGALVQIGNNCTIMSGAGLNPLSRNIKTCIYVGKKATLKLGNDVGISSSTLWVKESVSIGNSVAIGADCIIMDTDAHNLDWKIRCSEETNEYGESVDMVTAASAPIVIEDNVLVGARCIILKGVTIGARSIIGSGSIVTKDIPSDCIAAGNPCKVIKSIVY
ncbi:acyltransferase [Bacteroides caccae]|nr:acyltransferase [Bacteroides sp.]MBU9956795.1 acyltransferase [Bacteroides caccae]OKZ16295.1 MAG: hypothetical protein BHV72_12510 [Bacteroides sp. 43_46]MBV3650797.1 acyltransferase [Bacteroides caccae]MBV3674938.1 acyltransferase [Bacteroides caccae]